MTPSQQLPRPLSQLMLTEIRKLMEEALSRVDIPMDTVLWAERRWDIQDITASWPKDSPTRNIHAWVRGAWPRFFVEFEGAIWHDDEKNLQRSIRFIPFSGRPGIITVSGSTSTPVVTISDRDDLPKGLEEFAKELKTSSLTNKVSNFPLRPDPHTAGA